MEQSKRNMQHTLPLDIALKIASSLQVLDLCSLGSCSQFWRDSCGSDSIWESLTKQRWPSLHSSSFDPNTKGWKEIYIRMHRQMAGSAAEVVGFVEQCSLSESIDVGDYQKAIEDLSSMQLSFEDVQMFLFKPKLNVLLNLVGLHYCIFCLEMPADRVMDALVGCNILERKVHVKWWKLGRWFYGFRMRDESCSCWVSLEDLLTGKGKRSWGSFAEVLFMRCFVLRSLFQIQHQLPGVKAHRDKVKNVEWRAYCMICSLSYYSISVYRNRRCSLCFPMRDFYWWLHIELPGPAEACKEWTMGCGK